MSDLSTEVFFLQILICIYLEANGDVKKISIKKCVKGSQFNRKILLYNCVIISIPTLLLHVSINSLSIFSFFIKPFFIIK